MILLTIIDFRCIMCWSWYSSSNCWAL